MESNQNSLERYQRTQMRKENIIEKLRERGCRITKQRQILLDVILKEECSCCRRFITKQPVATVKSEWQPFTA